MVHKIKILDRSTQSVHWSANYVGMMDALKKLLLVNDGGEMPLANKPLFVPRKIYFTAVKSIEFLSEKTGAVLDSPILILEDLVTALRKHAPKFDNRIGQYIRL